MERVEKSYDGVIHGRSGGEIICSNRILSTELPTHIPNNTHFHSRPSLLQRSTPGLSTGLQGLTLDTVWPPNSRSKTDFEAKSDARSGIAQKNPFHPRSFPNNSPTPLKAQRTTPTDKPRPTTQKPKPSSSPMGMPTKRPSSLSDPQRRKTTNPSRSYQGNMPRPKKKKS